MLHKQLCRRFRPLHGINIIHDTNLDNHTPLKRLSLPEDRSPTLRTEVTSDDVAAIRCFGEFLWGALDCEGGGVDDNVCTVG